MKNRATRIRFLSVLVAFVSFLIISLLPAGAIVLPGVHIGKNSVIGAGSIVTRDIPENVLAVGSPCHIVREIDARDYEFYSRWDDRVDWENLNGICQAKKDLPKFN